MRDVQLCSPPSNLIHFTKAEFPILFCREESIPVRNSPKTILVLQVFQPTVLPNLTDVSPHHFLITQSSGKHQGRMMWMRSAVAWILRGAMGTSAAPGCTGRNTCRDLVAFYHCQHRKHRAFLGLCLFPLSLGSIWKTAHACGKCQSFPSYSCQLAKNYF